MIRFYLVPAVITQNAETFSGPKYFDTLPTVSGYSVRDYGEQLLAMVAADVSTETDAFLAAQADVVKFADNLDQSVGPDLVALQVALELLKLPAQMLTANTTYRVVMRGIMACFAVAQCMQGKGFNVFAPGVTLATTLSLLPVAARQALAGCAAELNYEQSGITGASTIRQVLSKVVAQASPSQFMRVTV